MRSLGTSRSPRTTERSKAVPRDSFLCLGDAVSGAAGPMGEALVGIWDVLLQGGQAGAAPEPPAGFGSQSCQETNPSAVALVTQLSILLLGWN